MKILEIYFGEAGIPFDLKIKDGITIKSFRLVGEFIIPIWIISETKSKPSINTAISLN